jgi:DNA-binding FadR family transcriptional regulator
MAQSATATRPAGRLHDEVRTILAVRILSGAYPQGSVLPNEAELSLELGVSRTSIREAIRVLSAKGLVESRQRVGTRVRPDDDWNRLDPEVLAWGADLEPDASFVRGLLEARRIIEPAAAELAALRATGRDLMTIEGAYDRMSRSLAHDLDACTEADLDFHTAILRASHNPVLSQLASVIGAALRAGFRVSTSLTRGYERTLRAHGDVLEAIRLRQPEQARSGMLLLIDLAAEDFGELLSPPVEPRR